MDFSPAHVHVMVVHLPLFGLLFGAIPLIVGLIVKQKVMVETGLWMVAVSGWSIVAVMSSGETAKELADQGQGIARFMDEAGHELLDEHYELAEFWAKPVYLAAVLASVGIVMRWVWGKWREKVAWAAAVVALLAVPGLGMVANSGGKVRHPEFRDGAATSAVDAVPAREADDNEDHDSD